MKEKFELYGDSEIKKISQFDMNRFTHKQFFKTNFYKKKMIHERIVSTKVIKIEKCNFQIKYLLYQRWILKKTFVSLPH